MELARMGFDLNLVALAVLANCTLVALGAALAAYFRRVIKRWEAEEVAGACLNADSNDNGHVPVRTVPASPEHLQVSYQPSCQPVIVQPPVHAVA